MLVLLFVALWFILRGDLFYFLPCVILFLCFFCPFSIAITSLGKGRAKLTFICSICACLVLSVSSSSWSGKSAVCYCDTPLTFFFNFFVFVALPGLSPEVCSFFIVQYKPSYKKGKRKSQGVPQSQKNIREKSRECHNHKQQPFPDTKRKRK